MNETYDALDLVNAEVTLHTFGEWSAVYVNGRLVPDTVGDSYIASEWLLDRFSVREIPDSNFLGGTSRTAFGTVEEIDAYNARLDGIENEAHALEEQAALLRRQAAEIRGVES